MRIGLLLILLVGMSVVGMNDQSSVAQSNYLLQHKKEGLRRPQKRGLLVEREDGHDAGTARYLRSFGGSLLGAAIGGGLGWLVGPVPREELFGDRDRRYGDPGEVSLIVPGVWVGSVVGAMAGGQTGVRSEVATLSGVGSFFGSLLGLGMLATVSGGRGPWGAAGFGVGAAAGAALGAVVIAPEPSGLIRRHDGVWSVGLPTIRGAPSLHPSGQMHVHVVLVSARF